MPRALPLSSPICPMVRVVPSLGADTRPSRVLSFPQSIPHLPQHALGLNVSLRTAPALTQSSPHSGLWGDASVCFMVFPLSSYNRFCATCEPKATARRLRLRRHRESVMSLPNIFRVVNGQIVAPFELGIVASVELPSFGRCLSAVSPQRCLIPPSDWAQDKRTQHNCAQYCCATMFRGGYCCAPLCYLSRNILAHS